MYQTCTSAGTAFSLAYCGSIFSMDAQVFLPSSQIPILYMPHLRFYGRADMYLFCSVGLGEAGKGGMVSYIRRKLTGRLL